MWRRSFIATQVALGADVDDALAAVAGGPAPAYVPPAPPMTPAAYDVATTELVARLREPHRARRAAALVKVVHEIVLRIEEGALR